MENSNQIINNLLLQSALVIAKQGALTQMTLGVYRETLEKDKYNSIVERFIDVYNQFATESLESLESVLLDSEDQSFLLRQKTQLRLNVEQMKSTFLI